MNSKIEHYLQSTAELLRNLARASQIEGKQADDLQVAIRLVDCLLIETSTGRDAADRYIDAVQNLLPAIERALTNRGNAESVDTIIRLGVDKVSVDFNSFLADVARTQRALSELDDSAATQLTRSLQKYDADYADAIFSEGLARATKAEADNRSGAVNIKKYDEASLLEYIKQQMPGNSSATIESSDFIPGGHSKFTLGIGLTGVSTIPSEIILRADASDQFSGGNVAYEYHLQNVLYERGVGVPKPLALEETGAVFGSPFMLSERASGETIGHMFNMPGADEKVLVDIAGQLAAIHKIPVEEFGDSVDNANNKISHKVLEWLELGHRDLEATGFHSATFEAAFSWLKKNADLNDTAVRVLVHGDFGLNNLLIENSEVQAVLDWEFAHIGNPAYDLGYFYFMAQALGSWDLFLESYVKAGAALPAEEQLNYNILFAATRLGVQCVQAQSAFDAGLAGIGAARVISNQYVNESILRMSGTMERIAERESQ